MKGIKLRRVGNSVGLILPKEILVKLKLEKGDTVFLSDTPSGIAIPPYNPTFQEQLEKGREFMREYCETLNSLEK